MENFSSVTVCYEHKHYTSYCRHSNNTQKTQANHKYYDQLHEILKEQ